MMPTKLLNIGTHRWSFRPQIGISQAIGRLILEFLGGATFYTRNGDFFKGHVRDQAPLYSGPGQCHLHLSIGNLGRGWAGRCMAAGGSRPTEWRAPTSRRTGGWAPRSCSRSVARTAIRVFGTTGLYARTGGNFNLLGVSWMHLWGGRKTPLKSPRPRPRRTTTRDPPDDPPLLNPEPPELRGDDVMALPALLDSAPILPVKLPASKPTGSRRCTTAAAPARCP